MIPYEHQEELSNQAIEILKKHMIVYLATEERTGKTLMACLVAEKLETVTRVLVVTKAKAKEGWLSTLNVWEHSTMFVVSSYHSAHKYTDSDFDLIILDEAHNYISAYPKPGKIWKEMKVITAETPLLYCSATPHPQGYQQLYHQFALSSWSPWFTYSNFYSWFRRYGKIYTIPVQGMDRAQYDRTKEQDILDCCEHLFITKTRSELGFQHEPEDVIHNIELSDNTKYVYNELLEHSMVELKAGMLVCETDPSLRFKLHQLEGGTVKFNDESVILENREKIDKILELFGDSENLVIMYNYKAELIKLKKEFKKATILQATSYAEGVDLHHIEHLVVYSQDFSTGRHTQRRARQCNMNRDTPINVHYLLVKNAISSQVYKTVSKNKRNFVDTVFERKRL